jgi:hypothetical protein
MCTGFPSSRSFLLLLLLIAMYSCKKSNLEISDPPVNTTPAITPIGIPIDDIVTKTIGPSGGSLISEDGKLELIIPNGAVSNNTVFGIQPITNYCPGGLNAFRLLPEGQVFANPVTLVFHYTKKDINGSLAELLGIAYQDSSGIWQRIPSANIDTIAKTISVEARHFSDWSYLELLQIMGPNSVRINKKISLSIFTLDELATIPTRGSGSPSSIPLPEPRTLKKATWYVNGKRNGNNTVGTIRISQDIDYVEFHAPAKVPSPATVTVRAELTNYKWKVQINNKEVSFNEVILLKEITIVPDVYNFNLRVDFNRNESGPFNYVYSDFVDVGVNVRDGIVKIENPGNMPPSVIPSSFTVAGGNCTVTILLDAYGKINITGGSGYVITDPVNNEEFFYVSLSQSNLHEPGSSLVCPRDPSENRRVDPVAIGSVNLNAQFKLEDSEQEVVYNTGTGLDEKYTFKLRPK